MLNRKILIAPSGASTHVPINCGAGERLSMTTPKPIEQVTVIDQQQPSPTPNETAKVEPSQPHDVAPKMPPIEAADRSEKLPLEPVKRWVGRPRRTAETTPTPATTKMVAVKKVQKDNRAPFRIKNPSNGGSQVGKTGKHNRLLAANCPQDAYLSDDPESGRPRNSADSAFKAVASFPINFRLTKDRPVSIRAR
jgi:hypothetical protein